MTAADCGCCMGAIVSHTHCTVSAKTVVVFIVKDTQRQRHKLLFLFSAYIEGRVCKGEANLHKVSHAGTHRQTHRRRDR